MIENTTKFWPKSQLRLRFFLNILCIIVCLLFKPILANESLSVDELLEDVANYLNTDPEKANNFLEKLEKLKPTFNKRQEGLYYMRLAISLEFHGKHKERVELIRSKIGEIDDLDVKAILLYQLSASLTILGEYEDALSVMNEEIILLPKLSTISSKGSALQAAINLLNSLGAYEEAIQYANRMSLLADGKETSYVKCYAYANLIEINFFKKTALMYKAI